MPLPFPWRLRPTDPEAHPRILREGCVLPAGAAAARVKRWWLSRGMYRVRVFSVADVPARDRRAVLRNLVMAWAPFDDCEYRVGLHADRGLALAWDARQVGDLLRAAGAASAAEVVPEGLQRPPIVGDGLRLLACLEGVEVQAWVSGFPVASRWWPQRPDASEWASFARSSTPAAASSAADLPASMPPMADVPWQSQAWLECRALEALVAGWSRIETLVAGVGAAGLLAFTAGQANDALSIYRQTEMRRAEIERLRSAATPVLASRDLAMAALGEADLLVQDLIGVQPIDVLRHLAEVLPAKGVTLREFDLAGNVLRLGLDLAPEVQRSVVVKDLQSGGRLSDVTEVREALGRNWVTFEMRLAGPRQPPGALRTVASAPPPRELP